MHNVLSIRGIHLGYEINGSPEKRDYLVALTGELDQFSRLRAEAPREVVLRAVYTPLTEKVYLIDLAGNGEGSGLESIGIGTLMLNTAIQIFRADCPEETHITGELTDVDDPQEDIELAKSCRERRSRFVKSFGLKIKAGYPWSTCYGMLNEIHLKTEPIFIRGMFPRYVELSLPELRAHLGKKTL